MQHPAPVLAFTLVSALILGVPFQLEPCRPPTSALHSADNPPVDQVDVAPGAGRADGLRDRDRAGEGAGGNHRPGDADGLRHGDHPGQQIVPVTQTTYITEVIPIAQTVLVTQTNYVTETVRVEEAWSPSPRTAVVTEVVRV